MNHLLKLSDLSVSEFDYLIKLAVELKEKQKKGIPHDYLKGKSLGMIFTKSSTRTRVSFEVGMYQLGGQALFLSSNDIQLGRGETIYDTANVLSRFLDGIMIRTFLQSDVEELAKFGQIPIINGLTDDHHPCQVLADMQTIYEYKGGLKGLKMAYVGDGNNMAHSLAEGCALAGMKFHVATPDKYKCNPEIMKNAYKIASQTGAEIIESNNPEAAAADADVIYTDTWISMGQESEKATKVKEFEGFCVNKELFSLAHSDAMFLHCLPAYRGFEVTEDVIDGPNSAIFDEAENRLHAQKAVMVWAMGNN